MKVEPRLTPLPHTGGSADFYVPFARAFTGGHQCVAVEYPGKRAGKDLSHNEAPRTWPTSSARCSSPPTLPRVRSRSSGTAWGPAAFEVALRFEQAGNPIAALFASASAAPGWLRQRGDLQGSDRELLSLVSDVTGANPEFSTTSSSPPPSADPARSEGRRVLRLPARGEGVVPHLRADGRQRRVGHCRTDDPVGATNNVGLRPDRLSRRSFLHQRQFAATRAVGGRTRPRPVLDRLAGHHGGDSLPRCPALGRRTVNAAVARKITGCEICSAICQNLFIANTSVNAGLTFAPIPAAQAYLRVVARSGRAI